MTIENSVEIPQKKKKTKLKIELTSVQFSPQSCPTLCNPMNRSTPGLPVHHQLPEFTQTHVHRVNDAIQPYHPLSFPSPSAPNPSQHQGLFQVVISSSNSAHGRTSGQNYNLGRYMCPDVYSSAVYNRQDMETI